MRKCVCAILVIFFSVSGCSKSDFLEDDGVCQEKETLLSLNSDSIQLLSSDCYNKCLPDVNVYHILDGTEISWSSTYSGDCGDFFLSCSGPGGYRSGYVKDNGTWYFSHMETAYTFSYTISCKSGCSGCTETKSFVKKSNKEDGALSSFTDCQKEYLYYKIEITDYNTSFSIINLSSFDDQLNTEDFLVVDSYKIYKQKYGTSPELIEQGTIRSDKISIPMLNNWEYCEIRLYSSSCKHNKEHYLYNTFHSDGLHVFLSHYDLQTVKNHFD